LRPTATAEPRPPAWDLGRVPISAAARREQADVAAGGAAPSIVQDALNEPGRPLAQSTRSFFASRFDHDFGDVRVHTGPKASAAARSVNAAAYTVSRDIVFADNQYAPSTAAGTHLLAHELAHTVQQRGSAPSGSQALRISDPSGPSEREAGHAADAAMAGRPAKLQAGIASGLQRQAAAGAGPSATKFDSDSLIEGASPFLAAAIGSVTLDGFDTGHSELKPGHKKDLEKTAHNIVVLLRKYASSTVKVTGFADTVGTEANNLKLGADRAATVKQALVDLGVPEAIISTDSKGEGAPQAVPTKDEVPNAKNRRVEVRFSPAAARFGLQDIPGLTPPGAKPPPAPPPSPPIDLNYHPKYEPPDPKHPKLPDDFWKPLPPPIRGSEPKSALDVIAEKVVDPVVDAVTKGLSKDMRDTIKQGARDALKAGVAKGARAAAQAAGVTDTQALDAIEKATEAAIQQKDKPQP
jgi:outer membrane protein OmpA-like peptidoglycan-associated protein